MNVFYSIIIQGPYSVVTERLILDLISLEINKEIILSSSTILDDFTTKRLSSLSVVFAPYKYIEPRIKKFFSEEFMHFNNQINGLLNGIQYLNLKSSILIKIRSDLILYSPKKFLNSLIKFKFSPSDFMCIDITSRDHSSGGPVYHLCDWIIFEKIVGSNSKFKNLKPVDEYQFYSYWRKRNIPILSSDYNQQFGLEQVIWMALLEPRFPPINIFEYSELTYDEYEKKLNCVDLINLTSLGFICSKYPHAHFPHIGRMRRAKFLFNKRHSLDLFIFFILDTIYVYCFEIFRFFFRAVYFKILFFFRNL
jgi:hypothetical protein